MARNDEGEFELVLGNKQLLSVFFIVVVLLGVFFTMGYIVGRNTASEAAEQMASAPGQPLVVESERAAVERPPAAEFSTQPDMAPAPEQESEPEPEPPPAAKPKPASPAPAPAKPKATPLPPPSSRQPAASGGISEPPSGTLWLQVVATSAPEAEVVQGVLSKRNFQTHLAPVPNQDIVRVLVGPLEDGAQLSETRRRLQEAGFKPFARRY